MTVVSTAAAQTQRGKTEVAEEAAEGTTIIQVATLHNSFFFYSKVIQVFAICLNRIVLVK